MKLILLFVLISTECLALDAVVKVLETPMLKYPSFEAPVVQYLRKGDVIKVDPSLNNETKYDQLAPKPEKLKAIRDRLSQTPEWKEDPLFKGTTPPSLDEDEFIRTLDRQGNSVYIIREHFYIYYESRKELTQTTAKIDPTDYRLEEPLPKNYPLFSPSGYRGQILVGFTQPYYESYPYLSNVKTKGYSTPFDFTGTALRKKNKDSDDRFFAGLTFNFRYFTNYYSFLNGRESDETGTKLGIGPYLSYDAFKGEKNRVNIFGSINVYLLNQLIIRQKDRDTQEVDERSYNGYSAIPRFGMQYHRKSVMEEIDFVIGTSVEMEPPTTFKDYSASKQPTWWRQGGSDKFKTSATFTLAGFIGLQSAY